jgi:hypothetical protein
VRDSDDLRDGQPARERGSPSLHSLRLGLPIVAMLGLEMGILEEKPQDLESERIEIDSDHAQKVIAIIERIES